MLFRLITFAFAACAAAIWIWVVTHLERYTGGNATWLTYLAFFVVPVVAAVALTYIALSRRRGVHWIRVALVAMVAGIYVAEVFVSGVQYGRQQQAGPVMPTGGALTSQTGERHANAMGFLELDRTRMEPEGLTPVSQLPDAEIRLCVTGDGTPITFRSDRYGFRNVDGDWDRQSLGAVIVGDSQAMGVCLPEEETFAHRMREELGSITNIATTGNGPLSNHASLREYVDARADDLRFRYLFWFHYSNDLTDLDWEVSTHLVRYLDSGLQGLYAARNNASAPPNYSKVAATAINTRLSGRSDRKWVRAIAIAKLTSLRTQLGLLGTGGEWTPPNLDAFEAILREAKRVAIEHGAEPVFVYLPSSDDTFRPGHNKEYAARDAIAVARKVGFQVIDTRDSFRSLDDPKQAYPPGQIGHHYSAAGHELIARTVLDIVQGSGAD